MRSWRCLIRATCTTRSLSARTRCMNIASSGQPIFLHHFVSRADVGFSTGSAHWQRVGHVGGGEGEWGVRGGFLLLKRKRKNCVAHSRERESERSADRVWWCVRIFQLQIKVLFFTLVNIFHSFTSASLDLSSKQGSGHINQTKFILGMGPAHRNDKPCSSNASLVRHNHCNHIFPEIHKSPNIGLCLVEESPIIRLTSTHCWLRWRHRLMNYTYGAGKRLREDPKWDLVRQSHTHKHTHTHTKALLWRERWRVGASVVKGGVCHDWAACSRLVHVCVSSYLWNLLQALARAAAERWMAHGTKARVVGKKRESERN